MTDKTADEARKYLRAMAFDLATGGGLVEPRAFDAALDTYRDALLAAPAVQAPATDRAARRDRIADGQGEPAALRGLPREVRHLVHAVDRMRGDWAESSDAHRAELWRVLHEASDAVWNRPLAVLSAPTDRAAVLAEAIARVRRIPVQCTALTGPVWFGQGWKDAIAEFEEIAERLAAEDAPLSPFYEHPDCGFRWHGRDGMDIPMQDGQPVCPRCELAKAEGKLAALQRRRDEVGAECKRRGKRVMNQAEQIRTLERQLDEVRRQLGSEILRTGHAEAELRRMAAESAAVDPAHAPGMPCEHGCRAAADELSREANVNAAEPAAVPGQTERETTGESDPALLAELQQHLADHTPSCNARVDHLMRRAAWALGAPRPAHIGGNAEDCPGCEDTNPPYPFICPGPTAEQPAAGAQQQPKEA
jgi:hypothetical protein